MISLFLACNRSFTFLYRSFKKFVISNRQPKDDTHFVRIRLTFYFLLSACLFRSFEGRSHRTRQQYHFKCSKTLTSQHSDVAYRSSLSFRCTHPKWMMIQITRILSTPLILRREKHYI